MFWTHFKYTLKSLFRNKSLLFWTYAFPIVLAMLFNLAFQDLEKNEAKTTSNIAIVNNEKWQAESFYQEAMQELSQGEDPLFHIEYVSKEKAEKLLANKKIIGYLLLEKEHFEVYVANNGVEETILQYVSEELKSTKDMISTIADKEVEKEIAKGNYLIDSKKIEAKVKEIMNTSIRVKDQSNKNMSYTMIEYYTLIAMACLYGGTISIHVMKNISPEISSLGKRFSITALQKGTLILGALCAGFVVQIVGVGALFAFLLGVVHADFGTHFGQIVLLALAGSFAGLSLGIFVNSMFKMNEGNKNGTLIGITMLCSFFSGMMGITMKFLVDTAFPILNKINPAAMITDGLYALYYYESFDRYYFDLVSLLVFSLILLLVSIVKMRRTSYDSL
ncbi:MAG: ABC transporter permease [Bacillota bacterium]|nr:ABC transporter permease [Bacillota bacterium]